MARKTKLFGLERYFAVYFSSNCGNNCFYWHITAVTWQYYVHVIGWSEQHCITPLCWVTFSIHSGIIPVGNFPGNVQINQSSVDFHCKPFGWLIDWYWWKVNFDLIGLLDSYRPICFYGGGAKVNQHKGIIQWKHSTEADVIEIFSVWHWRKYDPKRSFLFNPEKASTGPPPIAKKLAGQQKYCPQKRIALFYLLQNQLNVRNSH